MNCAEKIIRANNPHLFIHQVTMIVESPPRKRNPSPTWNLDTKS